MNSPENALPRISNSLESLSSILTNAGEFPSDLGVFAKILGISLIFGILLKLTYSLYFHQNEPQDGSLARSLVLLTPALAATFWMIQSSVALSLGLLGSLSFVRFRTPVKRSEDVGFIILSLAVAIASAGELFIVGAALIGMLFMYTIFRNTFFKLDLSRDQFGIITINTSRQDLTNEIMSELEALKVRPQFVSSRAFDGVTSYVFNASKISIKTHDAVSMKLREMDSSAQINIFFPTDRIGT